MKHANALRLAAKYGQVMQVENACTLYPDTLHQEYPRRLTWHGLRCRKRGVLAELIGVTEQRGTPAHPRWRSVLMYPSFTTALCEVREESRSQTIGGLKVTTRISYPSLARPRVFFQVANPPVTPRIRCWAVDANNAPTQKAIAESFLAGEMPGEALLDWLADEMPQEFQDFIDEHRR